MHIIKDENRGPTLEVVVSRMKTIQSLSRTLQNASPVPMRFVAVSATIPNAEDVSHNLHLLDFIIYGIYGIFSQFDLREDGIFCQSLNKFNI